MQTGVEASRPPRGASGRATSVSSVLLAELLHRAELLEQPGAPAGAEAGDVVEGRAGHGLVPEAAVVGDGEAVGLVPHRLEQVERLGVAGMRTGSGSPGRYTSSNRLARPATLISSRPRSSRTRHCDAELPLPPVDQEQVRRVGEPLPGPGPLVPLPEVVGGTGG